MIFIKTFFLQIIPAISDLLQLLQPSYSFPLDRHPETARFSDGTVLLTNEYVDRANLLLKTFNSLLTVCGSNNDVYLRSVPLVLKKIYTKLCQHPQSCGKEGEVVDVLNIDHVAKLVDISVILMRHSWRRFYDSPEII